MHDLIIAFESIGEANLYIVDSKTYDLLHDIYIKQEKGPQGYSEMMEEFWTLLNKRQEKGSSYVKSVYLQWNSCNKLKEPVTFKRILQVLSE